MNVTPGYTICGRGPAVILLHSSMSSKDQWKPLIGRLRTNFTIIAIDLTGYGENKLPLNPETFSLDDEIKLAQDILAKEKINNKPFHLIGHSYGGAIALKLALKMPEEIKTLTLFEPVSFHLLPANGTARNEIKTIVRQIALALKEKNRISGTKLFIDYWSGKGTFEKLTPKNQTIFIQYIDKVLLDFQALFNEPLTLEDYSKINIPVCMIKGEQSPLSSLQIFGMLEQAIFDTSIYLVPGGHMSPITHFKKVNEIIVKFLTAQSL